MSTLLEGPEYDFPEDYVPNDPSLGNIYRRFTVVWTAIAIFDTLATFPLEYKYIWKGERTLLMFLFLMNRWGGLLMQIMTTLLDFAIFSDTQCRQLYWFNALGGVWIAFFCSAMLSLRVYALWDKQKRILYLLVFMLLCLLGLTIGPTYQLRAALPPRELVDLLHLPGCEAEVSGKLSGGQEELFFASVLVFDAIVLFLTLYRTIVISRLAGRLPILKKLQRDGVWYYLVITVTNLVSLVFVVQTADLFLQPFFGPASLAVTSLMCSRLVFSLFESADKFASNKGSSSNGASNANRLRRPSVKAPTSPSTARRTVFVDRRSLITRAEGFSFGEKEAGVQMDDLGNRRGASTELQDSTGDLHLAPTYPYSSPGTPGVRVQRETHIEVN